MYIKKSWSSRLWMPSLLKNNKLNSLTLLQIESHIYSLIKHAYVHMNKHVIRSQCLLIFRKISKIYPTHLHSIQMFINGMSAANNRTFWTF